MNHFNKIFDEIVLPLGYKKTSTDEFLFGLSRVYYEYAVNHKQIWKELDWYKQGLEHLKGQNAFNERLIALCKGNSAIISEVKGHYRTEVWNHFNGEFIKDYDISKAIFELVKDTGVNGIKAICKSFGFEIKDTLSLDDADTINRKTKQSVLAIISKIYGDLTKIMKVV